MRSLLLLVFLTLSSGVVLACGDDDGTPMDGGTDVDEVCDPTCRAGEICERGTCVPAPLPDAICPGPSNFGAGQNVFSEVTNDWGLGGVEGVRLSVVDFDVDGRPDLVVRAGQGDGDFSEGSRRFWLLRNVGEDNVAFEDVTEASGILAFRGDGAPSESSTRPVDVIAFGDVDNDGDPDAYLGTNDNVESARGETSELFINQGDGTFVLASGDNDLRQRSPSDLPAGAAFIDFDRDGNLDLFVAEHNTRSGALLFDRLYRGDGAGMMNEVTDEAGVRTDDWNDLDAVDAGLGRTRAWGVLARDMTGDGYVDLMVPSYGRSPNHFWRNNGDGTFSNESVASGYAFDGNTSWTDNQFAACFCQANPGAEGCDEASEPLIRCDQENWRHEFDRRPFRLGGNSAATAAGDIDNDGDLDLLTGEIRHWWAGAGSDGGELLVNDGNGVFARPGDETTGLVVQHGDESWDEGHMTNALFDFDNDGRLDVYIGGSDYPGNRGRLFHQQTDGTFRQLATSEFFEHNRSHGVVVADFDGDGDLDIIVGHSRARCGGTDDCYERPQIRAFENTLGDSNFLQVEVASGPGINGMAIGAQVWVTRGNEVQVAEVDGGHGHYGTQSEGVLHFGLGSACEAEVRVRFPNAELTEVTVTLTAGHRFRVHPDGRIEQIELN